MHFLVRLTEVWYDGASKKIFLTTLQAAGAETVQNCHKKANSDTINIFFTLK